MRANGLAGEKSLTEAFISANIKKTLDENVQGKEVVAMRRGKRFFALLLAVVMLTAVFPAQAQAAAVRLNKTSAALYVGQSMTLKLSREKGRIQWSSSDRAVAAVTAKGKVTAKAAGKATVAAKMSGRKYRCRITVKNPYLNKVKLTLSKGETYRLRITGTSAKSWKSSDKAVAAVSSKGKVSAKGAGTAVIRCMGSNGKSYKCTVKVVEASAGNDSGKNAVDLSEAKVYAAMAALKKDYPEGTPWTNDNYYAWKGGIYSGGYGCAGFAFMLSDAAFGSLPARQHKDFSKIRVGDIVRMDYDAHSVIALKVKADSVIVAEGNYNSSVHWEREISLDEIRKTGTYVMTRYPQ